MDIGLKRFYEFDSFRVDVAERQLWQGEKTIFLTPKVFDMLLVLLENKGQTIEKDELIKKVWADTYVEEGSLNRNISTLRKALGDDSHEQKFIKTLPKRGYRFTAQVEEIFEEIPSVIEKSVNQNFLAQKEVFSPAQSVSSAKYTKIFLAIITFAGLIAVLAWMLIQFSKNKIDLSGLTENERQQLAKYGSADLKASQDYVTGRSLWHRRSAEDLHQSIIYLERAIKTDPNFALAHSALADAYAFDTSKRKLAESHANEAIRLNPSLGEPYATIGFVRMFWDWKLTEAQENFKQSVQLSPNYSTAHQWYAINLIASGAGGAALAEMKRAIEIEPQSLAINADLCQMYYFLRKYDEALAQCQKTLEMNPNFLNAHVYLYEIYTAKEMYSEAVEQFFKIEQLKSDFSLPASHLNKLRAAYQSGGIQKFWQTRIEHLEQYYPHSYKLAQYYARLGEKEKSLQRLKESFQKRDFEFILFAADPVFQNFFTETAHSELRNLID